MPFPSINPSLERSLLFLCLMSLRLCPDSIRITRFQWQRWNSYMACNPYQQRENGSPAGVVGATGLLSIQYIAGRLSTKVINRLPGAQCQIPACSTGLSRPRSQQTPYINHPRQTGGLSGQKALLCLPPQSKCKINASPRRPSFPGHSAAVIVAPTPPGTRNQLACPINIQAEALVMNILIYNVYCLLT